MSPGHTRLMTNQVVSAGANSGVAVGAPLTVQRRSAGSSGTLVNWQPRRLAALNLGRSREKIVERAIDLDQNDPHVSGLIEGMNINTVGIGFRAQSKIKARQVPIEGQTITDLQQDQEWELFCKNCDVHKVLHFVDFHNLADRSMLVRGEYLLLARMIKGSGRHSLKLQMVDPLRMKTPSDKMKSDRFIDGIELDGRGTPYAVWIHNNPKRPLSKHSRDYKRIKIWKGHRKQVFHGFIQKEPDQYRGQVFFSPAMKFFRDLSDLLDAEVVTNIITSAVAVFISSPDPTAAALAAGGGSAQVAAALAASGADGERIEEWDPGSVLYGDPGQKPELLQGNRPGDNFVPFIDTVLRAASSCAGIPLEVATKRYGDMSYSSARAALLEAWRVFGYRQDWEMRQLCSPLWAMVQEESYLKGYLNAPGFYDNFEAYTKVKWIPPAKGQLEPVKETQSNILKLKHNMITQTDIAAEAGKDWETDIAEKRKAEKGVEESCGLEYPETNANKAGTIGASKENAK